MGVKEHLVENFGSEDAPDEEVVPHQRRHAAEARQARNPDPGRFHFIQLYPSTGLPLS